MMVESEDGSRALLGRSKRMRPGMMTCLSGFIEQVCSGCLASEHGSTAACIPLTPCTPLISTRLPSRCPACEDELLPSGFPSNSNTQSGLWRAQGESIEEAVAREVMEEAGITVGAITILGSQPWPIGILCANNHFCLVGEQPRLSGD